ncbi:MAG TPA: hypothetical protein VGP82_25890, partial [Ktedonobacterales bacterium]|nr:hypothetical protein [Ktedonobacterales bacterium]
MSVVALVVAAAMHITHAPSTRAASGPLKPGIVMHAASCQQEPPQAPCDRATYTPAELAVWRYQLTFVSAAGP